MATPTHGEAANEAASPNPQHGDNLFIFGFFGDLQNGIVGLGNDGLSVDI